MGPRTELDTVEKNFFFVFENVIKTESYRGLSFRNV